MKVLQTNQFSEYSDSYNGEVKNSFLNFINFGKGENQYLKDVIEEVKETSQEKFEEMRENGEFIPPWEYTPLNSNTNSPGYTKLSTGSNAHQSNNYFWVEDLKNWCMYYTWVDKPEYSNAEIKNYACGIQVWQLYVWNGRDGFVGINSLGIDRKWEIRKSQEYFINKLNHIIVGRGNNRFPQNYSSTFDQWKNCTTSIYNGSPQTIVHGLILKNTRKYSINDPENYQTIRWSKPYTSNSLGTTYETNIKKKEETYITNPQNLAPYIRQGLPTGNPALWRLSTGELCLCSTLVWGGQIWMNGKAEEGGDDFLNNICKQVFGAGQDKTIKDDWLKEKVVNLSEENVSNIQDMSIHKSTLDTSQIEQNNKRTAKTCKLSFSLNDINVSINEKKEDDLISRW